MKKTPSYFYRFLPLLAAAVFSVPSVCTAKNLNSPIRVMPMAPADGTIDTDFGADGMTSTATDRELASTVYAASRGPDAGYVVVSSKGNAPIFIRAYDRKGILDKGFGTSGIVTKLPKNLEDVNKTSSLIVGAVAVQADGKILVAGKLGNMEFWLARYHPSGEIDTRFGINGSVLTSYQGFEFMTLSLQSRYSTKIIVGGEIVSVDPARRGFALVRFNADGTYDSTFGSNGLSVQRVIPGQNNETVSSIAYFNNELILASGFSAPDIVRGMPAVVGAFNDWNGALAVGGNFGADGTRRFPNDFIGHPENSIHTDRKNRAWVTVQKKVGRVNYGTDAEADTSFNGSGFVDWGRTIRAAVLQPDHKIVLADTSKSQGRYNEDGSVDASYVNEGLFGDTFNIRAVFSEPGSITSIGSREDVVGDTYIEMVRRHNLSMCTGTPATAFPEYSLEGVSVSAPHNLGWFVVSGLSGPAPAWIWGGEFSIGRGPYVNLPAMVKNGDIIAVRLASSDTPNTKSRAVLTIGCGAAMRRGTFSVTTN